MQKVMHFSIILLYQKNYWKLRETMPIWSLFGYENKKRQSHSWCWNC